MGTRIFRDIFNTPDMNWERWINNRALDNKFTWEDMWNKRKRYDQHRKLELNPPEKNTRMKIDELEAREHLHEGSPDQNIDWKEWRDFTWINGYLIKKSESLKKRVGGRENKGNLGWMRQTPVRKLRVDLADVENDRIHLKRSTPVEKELTWQPQWSKGLVLP